MEITTIQSFLDYHTKIRQRTMGVIRCIPADKIDRNPHPADFWNDL